MLMTEVLENLCAYDERNPCYFYDDDDPDDRPVPRHDCGCDACFYGTDRLAMEIIKLTEIIKSMEKTA